MRFVKASDLKRGMRLGRPIYNRKGELVYDIDHRLIDADIVQMLNSKIMGVFALDAAEPVPPMSDTEREYDRQRFLNVYALRDEMQKILFNRVSEAEMNMCAAIRSMWRFLLPLWVPKWVLPMLIREQWLRQHFFTI